MSVKKVSILVQVFALVLWAGAAQAEENEHEPGLVAEFFKAPGTLGDFMKIAADQKPTYVRVDKNIAFGNIDGDFYGARMGDNFQVRWTGLIHVEKAGKYEFATESDDGSRLFIDEKEVVNNGGNHAVQLRKGSVELKPGDHKLMVEFFQSGGGAACVVGWSIPGGKLETIPARVLFHAKGAENIAYDEAAWKKRPEGRKEVAGNAKIGSGGGGGGGPGNPVHEKMDYGPFLSGSIESSYPAGGNYALKGLAIRLGDKKQASVSFDTEMLRYSVGWTGEWLKLDYGRDGLEGHPTLRGAPKFGTKGTSIGWANKDGAFAVTVKDKDGKEKLDDPREKSSAGNRPEGPLPKDWGRYKGVYVDGRKVILHYTVGDADILEQPSFDDTDGLDVFTRSFQIGKSSKPLTMLLIEDDAAEAGSSAEKNTAALVVKDQVIAAALNGAPEGAAFALDGKRVLLKIPALTEPAKFSIKICNLAKADKVKFDAVANKKAADVDFDSVTKKGGEPRWKPIEVQGVPAKADDQAYVVDTITVPLENDYNSYMRLTGVDFFKDGRAAVCTMSGDVWVVSGIDKNLEKVTWRRYATGLFASLGLKIVNEQIYTLGRDQITRFYDLNNDGEADYYECFNNDCTVGPDYHEFAHDLHTDTEGNFYYMKGSNLSAAGGKFHGTMVRVDKNGEKAEMFCKGFRAPNGMCVGPHDEITTGDNQGNWTPSSPINWIKKGGFYGFQLDQYPETKTGPRLNPLCWVPYDEDNSCGGQVWGGANWGPLSNRLLHMSYGKCKLFATVIEKYGDEIQGGVVKFPLDFATGVMRARVNPVDGQVYVTGMKGWQTSAPQTGALQRVRYTGKPYNAPMEAKVGNNGITITFNEKLDPETTQDASNWDVRRFNIKYTGAYGSDEYSLENDSKHGCGDRAKRDLVEIKSVKLDPDGKTVKLELASVKLCTNMVISYKIQAADGTKIKQDFDYTVNFIQGGEKSPGMFPPEPQKKKEEIKKVVEKPKLDATKLPTQ